MGRSFNGDGTWQRPRDKSVRKDPARVERRRNAQNGIDPPNQNKELFVASIGVRHPIIDSKQLGRFLGNLRDVLPKDYAVLKPKSIGMTVLEQQFIIEKFRAIETTPDPGHVDAVAETICTILGETLRGKPETSSFVIGGTGAFGKKKKPTKLGLVPEGWAGFKVDYDYIAATGAEELHGPNPFIPLYVRESAVCIGAINNGFSDYNDQPGFMGVSPRNDRPHVTVAQKQARSGWMSKQEQSSMCHKVDELLTDFGEFELADPVMSVRLWQDGATRRENIRIPGPPELSVVQSLDDLAS